MAGDAEQPEPKPTAELVKARPGELQIAAERDGDTYVIALSGELDLATADEFEQELVRVEATDVPSIVVDLSGLGFIDSTGVRVILGADERSRASSNRLTLLHGPPVVRRVFELTGVIDLLPFAD